MLSPEAVYGELEADRSSRQGEIRLVERLVIEAGSDSERDMLKRSLVLLTYAHVEGFCRFTLWAYASALNSARIKCSDAIYPVVAATLSTAFGVLRDPNRKHEDFRQALPDDAQLHLAAREQAFLENLDSIMGKDVQIPDSLIDNRYNVSANVLKKMLFQLGLPYADVNHYEADITELLLTRNKIAHGDRLKIPKDEELARYLGVAVKIMGFLQGEVYVALKAQSYLRR